MADAVDKLRAMSRTRDSALRGNQHVLNEAANELEACRGQVARLRGALVEINAMHEGHEKSLLDDRCSTARYMGEIARMALGAADG